MRRQISLMLAAFFYVGTAGSIAQVTTGSITGTVRGPNGAVQSGANVEVRNEDWAALRTVKTNGNGRYSVPLLEPGRYRVTVTQGGFQKVVWSGIVVSAGRSAVVDVDLTAGDASQTMQIDRDAPPVDASAGGEGKRANERAIRDLPTNRSVDSMARLLPGVIQSAPGTGSSFEFGEGTRFSDAGARGYDNTFLLDGTNINDHANGTPGNTAGRNPGMDSVREVVVLNGGGAESGSASGAIVSAVSRSGGNQLHGSAYGFLINSATSARNFFDFGKVPPFRRTQFGGSLGGPLRKDRTFFFGNYEGFRQGLGVNFISFVPDANVRRGLLPSASGALVRFQIAPAVQPFLSLFPLPNGPVLGGGAALFFFSPTLLNNDDYFVTRIDHRMGEKVNLFGRYVFDDGESQTPQPQPTFENHFNWRRQYATLQATEVYRPSLLNAFRFAYNRTAQRFDSLPTQPLGPEFSFVPGQPIGTISIAGLTSLGTSTSAPRWWIFNSFEWGDDLTYVRGRHSFKAGGNVQRIRDNAVENTLARGAYAFTSLSDFFVGFANTFQATTPGSNRYRGFRQNVLGFYGLDEWKATSRLSVNLGLRWEAATDPTEAHGLSANLRSVFDSSFTIADRFFRVSKKDFEPRAGLAWQMNGSGKTVLRAGGGIYHDQLLPYVYARDTFRTGPFVSTSFVINASFPLARATPATITRAAGGIALQDQTPTTYDYHLSVEQQLWKGAVAEIAYIGAQARHLWRRSEQNTPFPTVLADGQKFFSLFTPTRNPSFGSIQGITTDSNSSYNTLRVSVRKTSASGLEFQAFYTFSKLIDDNTSLGTGDINSAPATTLDPDNIRRDRGLSDLHAAHQAVFYASYPLPFRPRRWPLALLARGWKLNAVGTFNSGRPFTVLLSSNRSQDRDLSVPDRPSFNPLFTGPKILGTPNHWFDPRAYFFPAVGTFGTLGRNTLTGPGLADADLSVEKEFRVGERLGLKVRAEFFNAFNHANFGQPINRVFGSSGSILGSSGIITSTVTPSRQIEFGARAEF